LIPAKNSLRPVASCPPRHALRVITGSLGRHHARRAGEVNAVSKKQGPRDGRKEKPRESGASPSLANVRTAWRVGGDLALSSRAYACSVAAETYLNRGIIKRLKLLPIAEPEVGSRNWARVGGGFLLDNPGSFYGRTRTSAADCAGGDQRHSNRKFDQLHGAVVLHGHIPQFDCSSLSKAPFSSM
jgi:hypothetical protein